MFQLLLFVAFCMGFSSCSDDEPESPSDVDNEVPTHDVVKTTVNAKAVVFSEVDGDLVGLFVKRLENKSVTPVITDDTELVVLDESSAASFLNNPQSFEVLKDFYSRGGIIYMDRPAMKQGAIVARLQYGIYNEVPDELIEPLYEAYIFRNDGSEKITEDLYNPEPHEVIITDADGKEYVEIQTDEAKPNEFFYGQFAESSADFINRLTDKTASRSGYDENYIFEAPPFVLLAKDFKLKPSSFSENFNGVMGRVEAHVRAIYSFRYNAESYHIMLKESFPGDLSWKDRHKGNLGFSYGGVDVDVRFNEDQYSVNALSPTPSNESPTGKEVMVETWAVTGEFGTTNGNVENADYNTGGYYRSRSRITLPVEEMNYKFTRHSDSHLSWTYNIAGGKGDFPYYTYPAAIGIKPCDTYQAWGWDVGNTWKYDKAFEMKADFTFYMCFRELDIHNIEDTSYKNVRKGQKESFTFKLPIPRRSK